MSDVNIPKQKSAPPVGSVVHMKEYFQDMIVTDVLGHDGGKSYSVAVVWLDSQGHPHHLILPIECLEEE